ncbi:MAG: hypothetical protein JRI68_02370 [Deltaproteobacteria bacterium]|nr:hypothetical protein [Deltaproteobacteria bacterium]
MKATLGSKTKWALLVATIWLVTGCADGWIGEVGPEEGIPAPNEEVGEVIDDADPNAGYDPCLEDDICPDEDPPTDDGIGGAGSAPAMGGASSQGGAPAEGGAGGGTTSEPEPEPPPTGQYEAGDLLLVLKYAKFRKQPSNTAGTKPVHTNGGAHGGHPSGYVPPGQVVTMLNEPKTNGYYKVAYKGYQGWIYKQKLALVNETMHPVKYARQAAVRDAFFMHQIRRSQWNKDGPSSSANCAPTSLAMAAKIFDVATRARTIEKGIHEARNSYNAPSNESIGTTRAQIRIGAKHLGFTVKELGTNLSTANDEMNRIDKQLGWNRVVVLEGQAMGSQGAAYRNRMTQAYHAEGVTNAYYYYQGRHSILVVSRLANGKYVVADPLSEVGMVTLSRTQLKSFFKYWGGTGNALHL